MCSNSTRSMFSRFFQPMLHKGHPFSEEAMRCIKACFEAWKYNRLRCRWENGEYAWFTVESYEASGWDLLLKIEIVPQHVLRQEYDGQSFFVMCNVDYIIDKTKLCYDANKNDNEIFVHVRPRESLRTGVIQDERWEENCFYRFPVYSNHILLQLKQWLVRTTQQFGISLQITEFNFEDARASQDPDDPLLVVSLLALRKREKEGSKRVLP